MRFDQRSELKRQHLSPVSGEGDVDQMWTNEKTAYAVNVNR